MGNAAQLADFVGRNATVIGVAVNALTLVVTTIYVALTYRIVKESQSLRIAQTSPMLSVFLIPSRRSINMVDIVISNLGNSPAVSIDWQIEGDVEALKERGVTFHEMRVFERLDYLPQGGEIRTRFGNAVRLLNGDPVAPITLTAQYRDLNGNTFTGTYKLDPNQFVGLRSSGTDPVYEMSDNLAKISKTLDRIADGRDPIKAIVYSEQEYRRIENRFWDAQDPTEAET